MPSKARQQLRAAQAAKAARQRLFRIIGVAVALVVVLGIILAAVLYFNQTPATSGTPTTSGTPATSAKAIVVNPGKAPASAPLVEVFFDYQCPICHVVETSFGPEFEKLADAGTIQLQYRTMTFLDQNLRNDSSTRAAVAAACADTVGVYSAYHDQIFANQPAREGDGYPDTLFTQTIPATIGLSGDKLTTFQQCYAQKSTATLVKQIAEQALRDGVTGTPTVRVNGKKMELPADPSTLGAAITQAAK